MWPKILIELIPHISRLVPMADKFFSSRSANDEATQQAITALRNDLAQTASTHNALYRQMNDQSARISEAAADARATREAIVGLDARLTEMEKRGRLVSGLTLGILCLTIFLLVAVVFGPYLRH